LKGLRLGQAQDQTSLTLEPDTGRRHDHHGRRAVVPVQYIELDAQAQEIPTSQSAAMNAVEPRVGDGSVVPVDSHGNILNPLSPARGLYIRGVNEMIAVVVARSAKFSARRAARPFHPIFCWV
jgi:hypothetical protein